MNGKQLSFEVSEGQVDDLARARMLHFSTCSLAVIGVVFHGNKCAEMTTSVTQGKGSFPTKTRLPQKRQIHTLREKNAKKSKIKSD